jgi:hypothetical protein
MKAFKAIKVPATQFKVGDQVKFPDPLEKHQFRYGQVLEVKGTEVKVEVHATHVPREVVSHGRFVAYRASKTRKVLDAIRNTFVFVHATGTAIFRKEEVSLISR